MTNLYGLTPKEYIELRLKCLEPFITIASKTQIEQDVTIRRAEIAWTEFVVKPLEEAAAERTQQSNVVPQAKKTRS